MTTQGANKLAVDTEDGLRMLSEQASATYPIEPQLGPWISRLSAHLATKPFSPAPPLLVHECDPGTA